MAANEDIKIAKSLIVPVAAGTLIVVCVALLGRIMSENKA